MKTIKILKLFLTVTLAILASSNIMLAKHVANKDNDPPKFVYRMDTRGDLDATKNVIFRDGFYSRGANTHLLDHIYGEKQGIFISTTADMIYLVGYFADHPYILIKPPKVYPTRVYIYKIRASSNFYGVQKSVAGQPLSLDMLDIVAGEDEWVALNHIPSDQIESAAVYHLNKSGDKYVIEKGTQNSNYKEAPSTGNSQPYVVVPVSTKIANVVADIGYKDFMTLGFCPNAFYINKSSIVNFNYGIKGSCAYPLVLDIDHMKEELKAYKNYMLSNKLGYMKAQSHDEL